MNRSIALIFGSIFLAIIAGIINFELLSSPAVTIANENGEMQLLVYFFFLVIALTFATVLICVAELYSLIKSQTSQIRLPDGRH